MPDPDTRRALAAQKPELDEELADEEYDEGGDEEVEQQVGSFQTFLQDRRKVASFVVIFVAAIVAIYVLFPKIVGLRDVLDQMGDAKWYWVVVAAALNVVAFGAYVALFRGILGGSEGTEVRKRLDLRASYQVTMAGLAATRIFSAGGAGGIAITYWALRKAGMPRRRTACRMVAFLALMYSVYLFALILFGVLLRTGVMHGQAPLAGTIVPAAISGGLIGLFLLVALIPQDVERRMERFAGGYRRARFVARLAKGPATMALGVRTAIDYVRHPSRGALAVGGAVCFWAANIAVLWASFKAFGGHVPFAVLVQGFFLGMAANLIPSPAGGVGSVDAGMIGAFVLFGVHSNDVFPAVLLYRLIAFWLPIPPGIVAYFQLRSTVSGWEEERRERHPSGVYTSQSKVKAAEAT